jgi:hypothetical protein
MYKVVRFVVGSAAKYGDSKSVLLELTYVTDNGTRGLRAGNISFNIS